MPYASAFDERIRSRTETDRSLARSRTGRRRASRLAAWLIASLLMVLGMVAGAAPVALADVRGGQVIAWGWNGYDASGIGQTTVPYSLRNKTVTAVAGGSLHSLALTSDGQVTAWGSNSDWQTTIPAALAGKRVTAIAAGQSHSLALTADGRVTGWGNDRDGQSSVPPSLDRRTVTAIAGGNYHSLALTSDGQVVGWGSNYVGETTVPSSLIGKTVVAIAANGFHSLALTFDGQIVGWGSDEGQTEVPASLDGKKVTAISTGRNHSIALTADGKVTSWGDNNYGQTVVPPSLAGRRVTAISAGWYHNLALTSDGQVIGWGSNSSGESTTPTSLAGRRVTAIASWGAHNLAVVPSVPTVAAGPVSVIVKRGAQASFTAQVTGESEPTVQWQRSGRWDWFNNIPGATSTTYTVDAVTTADHGAQFRAVFTNVAGSVTTDTATLKVNDPPNVTDQTLITPFGQAVSMTLSGEDIDGDNLTFAVVDGTTHGTLTGSGANLIYTPDDGYSGADEFSYTAHDGTNDSTPATVDITVLEKPNEGPTAKNLDLTIDYQTATPVILAGTDPDGDKLRFGVVDPPTHGKLTGTSPYLTYTPAAGYSGVDAFTYIANDGTSDSPSASARITVSAKPNKAPTAKNLDLTTDYQTATPVTLAGTDPDGDKLSFGVVDQPTHGKLTGTSPYLSYTPDAGYSGPDSFTYITHDGKVDSPPAVAKIWVAAKPNAAPTAKNFELTTGFETAIPATLAGTDPDGDKLTFGVVEQPTHGMLTGTSPYLTYTPAAGYSGLDAFTYRSNDGSVDSPPASVRITVSAKPNQAPTAKNLDLTTDYQTAIPVILAGTDPEGDKLKFAVLDQPTHGKLTGTSPYLTYTPAAGYSGLDAFTYRSNDGSIDSPPASVRVTVSAKPNQAPTATNLDLAASFETAISVTLAGADPDGNKLTFGVLDQPTHGKLTGTSPYLTYTPAAGYSGLDALTYIANDGSVDSPPATVKIRVAAKSNKAPTAKNLDVATDYQTAISVTLVGADPDGDKLSFGVVNQPTYGKLTGTSPYLTYTPAAGYSGLDTFTYVADDGTSDSSPASVRITVSAKPNSAPTATNLDLTTGYQAAIPVTLVGADPDGDKLRFGVVSQPTHGKLTGTSPNLTYTPAAGYSGPDAFTFIANDGTYDSPPAAVKIRIGAKPCVPTTPTKEFHVSANQSKAGSIRSGEIETKKAGELLVAFVAVDGPSNSKQSVAKVSGGGLAWKFVQRDNVTKGTSEIWQAYAASKHSKFRVTAAFAKTGYTSTMTVAGFSLAGTVTHATSHASGSRSTPTVTITPKASQSRVWAVGRVIGSRYDLKEPSGQSTVHDVTFKSPQVGYWIQEVKAPTIGGRAVTVYSKSTTTHTWGYAAVEIQGVCR